MIIKINKKEDFNLYRKYLLDKVYIKRYPFIQKKIINVFPQLKNLEKSKNSEQKLDFFIESLYTQHKQDILKTQENMDDLFVKHEDNIVDALSKSMDYPWEKIREYTIFLSLFPFSTFGESYARVSILDSLWVQKKEIPYLDIFIHEISHVIVKEYLIKNDVLQNQIVFDCLKELMAPILMRSVYFEHIPISKQSRLANPEYEYLYFNEEKLIDNLEKKYLSKKKETTFEVFLLQKYDFLKQFELSLKQKKELFNQIYSWWNMRDQCFIEKLKKSGYFNSL